MPFAIENVRLTDLTWLLAGAGGPRMLASLGAEDIRVEWRDRPDWLRMGNPTIPIGADKEKLLATGQPSVFKAVGMNQGGTFAENNPGKRGISLNIRTQKGKELFKELVRISDIVVECFTAQTMDRLGLGYDVLKKVNPGLIYVQQPGFGKTGLYTDFVSTGPVAQSISGLTEQSGLPDPYPPAGWGYSYMDWSGAYYCAMAMLSALYYRARTGEGQYMDCSQAEPGIYMTGTAILDYAANGRRYSRTGNRSPYWPAAPHGAYRTRPAAAKTEGGATDRWIAIACYTDEEWQALCRVLGRRAGPSGGSGFASLAKDARFKKLAGRLMRQDELDRLVESATLGGEGYDLMFKLQDAGIAAGVCQNAYDRMFKDPQLQHRRFQVELDQSFVGKWQVKDFPVHFSESPAHAGGTINRGFPSYGEDNDYVFGTLLGLGDGDQKALAEDGVI